VDLQEIRIRLRRLLHRDKSAVIEGEAGRPSLSLNWASGAIAPGMALSPKTAAGARRIARHHHPTEVVMAGSYRSDAPTANGGTGERPFVRTRTLCSDELLRASIYASKLSKWSRSCLHVVMHRPFPMVMRTRTIAFAAWNTLTTGNLRQGIAAGDRRCRNR
jgi:hypothetical protein